MKITPAFILLLLISLETHPQGKCGTPLIFAPQPFSPLQRSGAQNGEWAARTRISDHFAIHYTMTGIHAVLSTTEDEPLWQEFEDYLDKQGNGGSLKSRHEAAYQALDAADEPHPRYIDSLTAYFELAYEDYIVKQGMKLAQTTRESRFYERPHVSGKYQVEVVDISAAENYAGFEIYALTYPPGPGEGIVMENDFLFNAGNSFQPDYKPITSVYNRGPESRNVNYNKEWEKGLKVTAVHEFYHAVQYGYTPNLNDFHFWYEASATGQEEVLAPEVNDYLQYLPTVFDRHQSSSLTRNCVGCLETYGNAIFFTFLQWKLGEGFDKKVWESLGGELIGL